MAPAMADSWSGVRAWSSQPQPHHERFRSPTARSYRSAWCRGRGATLVRVLATGYVYDLLRKLGLSTFGARTGEFLLVRPLKVVLVVVAAMVVSRLAARWLSRTVRSVQLRTLAGRSRRAEQRADTVAGVLSALARIVVWAIAALIVFDELGIDL